MSGEIERERERGSMVDFVTSEVYYGSDSLER